MSLNSLKERDFDNENNSPSLVEKKRQIIVRAVLHMIFCLWIITSECYFQKA